MNKAEFEYYLSNGKFAIEYLQHLANTSIGKEECNKAFNHGVAVTQVVRMAELYYKQVKTLEKEIKDLQATIIELKNGDYKKIMEEEINRNGKSFQAMKDSLIDIIRDFPDIEC